MTDVETGQRQWLHDVNNAVNTIGVTVSVINHLMARGEFDHAKELAVELEAVCDRCRKLLRQPSGESG